MNGTREPLGGGFWKGSVWGEEMPCNTKYQSYTLHYKV